ncbi:hypothetical protein DJFAAGMI_01291 [Comamonas sp. PE63]|uniref:DUF1376 domain-containing protein n=1 Tax=Comamonas brasiliensis TaxID=1812482 RepID=A0ABS5LPY1_9BURK|nr:YdaU family protein [Comamonas sp. PE63]MBS3018559.1 hypothetical protein [Comamonas sp. PE63]
MNYFPFHLGDYAAHTAHLEPLEDLAYRRMLDQYYLRECPLPKEPAEVARLIRMRANVVEVEAVLREFFTQTSDGWINTRADQEILRMRDKQAKARASAEASVAARQAKANKTSSTPAERTLNERSTGVELPTPTPTPINNSVAIATGGEPPKRPDPAEIIFGYGLSLLINAGTSERQGRSFLGGLRKAHGDEALIDKLRECAKAKPLQPLEWLAAALPPPGSGIRAGPVTPNRQEALERRNRSVADAWAAEGAGHAAV